LVALLSWVALPASAGIKDILPGGDKPPKPKIPTRFTAIWTDTTLNTPGQHPVRGFGGRVMFYDTEEGESIAVDGELTVYAYRDGTNATAHNIPAKKFVFRAEDLARHYSKSPLGHSYSFWLPWDRVGGPQEQLSLIARFQPRKGRPIASDITRRVLPGTIEQVRDSVPVDGARGAAPSPVSQSPVSQTGHYQPVVNQSVAEQVHRPKMSAETIELPPSAAARSKQGTGQAITPGAAFHTASDTAHPTWPAPQASYPVTHGTRHVQRQLPQQPVMPQMAHAPTQDPNGTGSPNIGGMQPTNPTFQQADPTYHQAGPTYQQVATVSNEQVPLIAPLAPGPRARFAPRTPRALGGSIHAPRSTRVLQRPHHAGWPNDPPTRPEWAQSPGWPTNDSAGSTLPR